jgi:hypothetical protein
VRGWLVPTHITPITLKGILMQQLFDRVIRTWAFWFVVLILVWCSWVHFFHGPGISDPSKWLTGETSIHSGAAATKHTLTAHALTTPYQEATLATDEAANTTDAATSATTAVAYAPPYGRMSTSDRMIVQSLVVRLHNAQAQNRELREIAATTQGHAAPSAWLRAALATDHRTIVRQKLSIHRLRGWLAHEKRAVARLRASQAACTTRNEP